MKITAGSAGVDRLPERDRGGVARIRRVPDELGLACGSPRNLGPRIPIRLLDHGGGRPLIPGQGRRDLRGRVADEARAGARIRAGDRSEVEQHGHEEKADPADVRDAPPLASAQHEEPPRVGRRHGASHPPMVHPVSRPAARCATASMRICPPGGWRRRGRRAGILPWSAAGRRVRESGASVGLAWATIACERRQRRPDHEAT